ncbi:rhodanese-like domain-containing protein [Desulfococcaceae bacterium HSG8]|nr:rhodanese-like domain-containing protein [Desulfococcaceae bacterium HSG8]
MVSVITNVSTHTADVVFEDTTATIGGIKDTLKQSGYSVSYVSLSPAEAKNMIDNSPELIIADVGERSVFCSGHIPSAVNYPGDLTERYTELTSDSDILVVSADGSATDADFLASAGFTSVYNMPEGMSAWDWETADCCHDMGLEDVILALQIIADTPAGNIGSLFDVNEDGRIGLAEVICILKAMAGLK